MKLNVYEMYVEVARRCRITKHDVAGTAAPVLCLDLPAKRREIGFPLVT